MNLLAAMTILSSLLASCPNNSAEPAYVGNREPLVHKPYSELPLGAVRAEGWLRDQLQWMAEGMTGHLDEIVPNIMGDSNGWLGGDGDKWERGPYWIDGLVPLAYILDDDALKAKAQRWVEWILASQQENGFFGPSVDLPNINGLQRTRTHDWWPRIVVLKILQQYYEATCDQRVIPFMTNYFKYQLETLPEKPLGNWSYWAVERGGDNIMVVYWLYNITGDSFLLDLGKLLTEQTADWKGRFDTDHTLSSFNALHCVNVAQGFKTPVIEYQANGNEDYLKSIDAGYADLMKYLGWPNGMYGADELLHSANPTQGAEFCSVVELMFSLERMIEITGRTDWADWLERIAFNALPTQATDRYDARQYYQQLNQVEVSCRMRNFNTSYAGTEGCFGPITGFPCCTANMHQGWPKFVRDLWLASDDGGLAAMVYAPCRVSTTAGGTTITIKEDGGYPFKGNVRLTVEKIGKSVSFPIHLRIPGWCKEATVTVNGEAVQTCTAGQTAVVERKWKKGDAVELTLPMEIKVGRWYEMSAAVERGPLVYALRMNENWEKVPNTKSPVYGEWFYEVRSDTPWNYCFQAGDVKASGIPEAFSVKENEWDGRYPWNLESAPVEIHMRARRIAEWEMYSGSAGPIPYSNQEYGTLGPVEDIVLIPYGCTTLRITEFPVTDQK